MTIALIINGKRGETAPLAPFLLFYPTPAQRRHYDGGIHRQMDDDRSNLIPVMCHTNDVEQMEIASLPPLASLLIYRLFR
jgi:hypothetical protein